MKTIGVPVDPAAAGRLDMGVDRDGDVIEVVLAEDAFGRLFASGWVAAVNEAAECRIDDFEDEHVQAHEALEAIARVTRRMAGEDQEPFRSILRLVDEAKRRGTGLHFHF